MTFAKISTDDKKGKIKAYFGEGEFTEDPVDTLAYYIYKVPNCR